MIPARSLATRIIVAMALLLAGFCVLVVLLGRHVAAEHEQEALQRLSHGLARHIVEHWPEIAVADPREADAAARKALLSMLMVVNPGIQVYLLDADGRVNDYIGEPGMVRVDRVDLDTIRAFLAGAPLPLRATDPMGSGIARIFSAAMFPQRPGDQRPPGYLYVVLDGTARDLVAGQTSLKRVWQGAGLAALAALAAIIVLGIFVFRRLTLPLRRLAEGMRAYSVQPEPGIARPDTPAAGGDEVRSIDAAFDAMKQRIADQARREKSQTDAHREMMAGVAHDLRTPLTALHGHLEALAGETLGQPTLREPILKAALAQSDKVRRLSQQLFELAVLQSAGQVLHRERFRLDELVTDVVQKFDLGNAAPAVLLGGDPPGSIECDGDLHLIERALTNLIDNAMRHAPGDDPVRVSLRRAGMQAQILIEDAGPGLSDDLIERLIAGRSLRDPPARRSSGGIGGIGGLGLAIAQRVAVLHGGSLQPLPSQRGGTTLCLALPLEA